MVRSGESARGQKDDQKQGRGGKADDDRREYQGLRNRVGKVRRIAGRAGVEDRRHARPQASHAEDEQVDRVGDERQPDNDLEGTRPQQQPHALARKSTGLKSNPKWAARMTATE